MNKIILSLQDLKSLICNDLKLKDLKLSEEDLLYLITGEIIEIDNNLIMLSITDFNKISNILDKHKKIIK